MDDQANVNLGGQIISSLLPRHPLGLSQGLDLDKAVEIRFHDRRQTLQS